MNSFVTIYPQVIPGTLQQLADVFVSASPPFMIMDTQGGRFWSRRHMVQEGIENFRAHLTAIGQPMPPSPVCAVLDNQACFLYHVEPGGRA